MAELNDSSAIKLFGKMIPLPTLNYLDKEGLADHDELGFRGAAGEDFCDRDLVTSSSSDDDGAQDRTSRQDQESTEKEILQGKQEDSSSDQIREDLKDPTTLSGISDSGTRSHLAERKTSSLKSSKNEEISETTSSQEKTLKKPDKVLPCPRCHSKETKFCYYNNYNVNQPRHFCKRCQRYWTAGGTMRNVPVGAGRRKTKSSSALQYHQIVISEAIRAAQVSAANGIPRNPSCENINSHVLIFGSSDSSIPMASVYNLSGKTQINVQKNGFHKPAQRILVDEDNHSGESLITASYSSEKEGNVATVNQADQVKNYPRVPSKIPFFSSRPARPYPWDPIPAMLPPSPALCHPGFPVTFQQGQAYLQGYCLQNPWDVPVASPSPSSVNQCPPSSNPTSPTTLGKRSRDESILGPAANLEKEYLAGENNKYEGRDLVSKTLRIDDPGEPAKSSMLASLVIKSKRANCSSSGGLFEGFQSKSNDERSNFRLDAFSVLRANPAALSRALNFHENTQR